MKTAEEIYTEIVCSYWSVSPNLKAKSIEAMKVYSKQVAEQALSNADKDVEEQLKVFGPKDEYISEAILKAEIITP